MRKAVECAVRVRKEGEKVLTLTLTLTVRRPPPVCAPTGSATNQIWVVKRVKTCLQLSASERPAVGLPTATPSSPGSGSIFGGTVSTIRQIGREEGIRGFLRRPRRELSRRHRGHDTVGAIWASQASDCLYGRNRQHAGMGPHAGLCRDGQVRRSLVTNPHEVRHPHTPDAQI